MIRFKTAPLAAFVMAGVLVAAFTFGLQGQEPATGERQTAPTRPMTAHRPSVPGIHGLLTTGHPLASMAGARVMLKGGNAFDATVAVLATLNVTEPAMSGAGGNGFMTLYEKKTGKFYSLNATGQAPNGLKPEAMTAELLNEGAKSSLTPGLFGGWILLLDKFGTKSLAELLEPAIEYAEQGHPIDEKIVRDIEGRRRAFERFATSARIFLPGGKPPAAGQMFKNPDLARTFRRVVEAEQQALKQGKSRSEALRSAYNRFYKGDIAQDIAKFFRENDGLITLEDLAAYKPKLVEPIHSTYRGYDVYTSPSTSRGGFEVLMQLNLIEGFDLKKLGHNSAETLHLMAESIKLAKADIYKYVADPAFTKIPVEALLSKEYAAARRRMIDQNKTMSYPEAGHPGGATATGIQQGASSRSRYDEKAQDGHTTSFSIVDQAGNVISVTPTLGAGFGTGMVVGNTGLFFNNGMRIGSTSPYPDNVNFVAPGKIPLLNNSPLLVFKDGKFVMSFGSPGGETIGQTQFQMAVNVLDFGMPVQQAIEAPRMSLVASPNFYKPGSEITMGIERRVSPEVVKGLQAKGHKVRLSGEWSMGSMQAIVANPDTGAMTAGGDPRRTVYAIGW